MSQREKDTNLFPSVFVIAGLLVVFSIYLPEVRFFAIAIGLAFLIPFSAIMLYRWRRRSEDGIRSYDPNPAFLRPIFIEATSPDSNLSTTDHLTNQLRELDWFHFEKIVALTYRKLGYHVNQRGGVNTDGGIDLFIEKSSEPLAVQYKHWKTWDLGEDTVRQFLGALKDLGLKKGILLTLGGFTGEAKQLADQQKIQIVQGTDLARMLQSVDAEYDPDILAILRDTRKYCPKCETEMILKTAQNGSTGDTEFWSCSQPDCQYTQLKAA